MTKFVVGLALGLLCSSAGAQYVPSYTPITPWFNQPSQMPQVPQMQPAPIIPAQAPPLTNLITPAPGCR